MTIANLQTLGILKKARLSKDAVGGAVSTGDLKAGGLLRPEQGWRSGVAESRERRKPRKPVVLGKSCSEVAKAYNPDQPRGHGGRWISGSGQPLNIGDRVEHPKFGTGTVSYLGSGSGFNRVSVEADGPSSILGPEIVTAGSLKHIKDGNSVGKAKDALGHGSEKRGTVNGKDYHYNTETQRWHDKSGRPNTNQGIHDKLNASAIATAPNAKNMSTEECRQFLLASGGKKTVEWLDKEKAPLQDWQGWVEDAQDAPLMDALTAGGKDLANKLMNS
jgi:hypothetical protein